MGKALSRRSAALALAACLFLPASLFAQDNAGKLVILILGPPGGGKTTQSKNLSRKYKIPSYSMSWILNQESGWVKNQYKKSLSLPMATGDFVNDELANQLVSKHITTKKARNGFILDGYPRSLKQAQYLETTLRELGLPQPIVIDLKVPEAMAAERLRKRGKKQDKPEIIEMRMADYRIEADFIHEHYKSVLRAVDGTPSASQVWPAVQKAVEQ